ncbi:hypothetical protein [Bacillus sp. Fil]
MKEVYAELEDLPISSYKLVETEKREILEEGFSCTPSYDKTFKFVYYG